jgi:hypothetical protein
VHTWRYSHIYMHSITLRATVLVKCNCQHVLPQKKSPSVLALPVDATFALLLVIKLFIGVLVSSHLLIRERSQRASTQRSDASWDEGRSSTGKGQEDSTGGFHDVEGSRKVNARAEG